MFVWNQEIKKGAVMPFEWSLSSVAREIIHFLKHKRPLLVTNNLHHPYSAVSTKGYSFTRLVPEEAIVVN